MVLYNCLNTPVGETMNINFLPSFRINASKIQNIKNLQSVFYDKGIGLEISKNKLSM